MGNRAGFERRLAELMHRQYETGIGFVLLMIDLDRCKETNDTHDHHVGDQVLQLMKQADEALYRAKRQGRNQYCVVG